MVEIGNARERFFVYKNGCFRPYRSNFGKLKGSEQAPMKYKKILYPAVFLLLIALTIGTIVSQNESFSAEGFADFVSAANLKYMVGAALSMLCYIMMEGMALLVLCRALGYERRLHCGMMYSAADIYFSAITPSATGGQPASAILMMRDGIPGAVTTVALLMNLALYTLSILVMSLMGCAVRPDIFGRFGPASRVLILVGFATQAGLLAGFLLLIFREKLMWRLVNFFSKILHKMRIFKNEEKFRAKLASLEQDYRQCAGRLHAHRPGLLLAFLLNFLQRLAIVLVPAFVYVGTGGAPGRLWDVIVTQSLVVVGSNAIPVPGAVGVADYLFLDGFEAIVPEPVNLELLSRGISLYCCIALCALALLLSVLARWIRGQRAARGQE